MISEYISVIRRLWVAPKSDKWRPGRPSRTPHLYYKRWFDLLCVTLASPIWIPACAAGYLLVLLCSGAPGFYTQERLGQHGRIFRIIKLRTMIRDAEKDTGPVWATRNDARITGIGRILRITGMDELPQIINAVKGDMSLVGPRPERPVLADRIAAEIPNFPDRLSVPPGLCSFSHVKGDSFTPARTRLKYDLIYIKNASLFFDVYVMSMICLVIIRRIVQRGK